MKAKTRGINPLLDITAKLDPTQPPYIVISASEVVSAYGLLAVAANPELVKGCKLWLNRKDGRVHCPYEGTIHEDDCTVETACNNLCYALWPELRTSGACPCHVNKSVRTVFTAVVVTGATISALNKEKKEPPAASVYRGGDVFYWVEDDSYYILGNCDFDKNTNTALFTLVGLEEGSRLRDAFPVKNARAITMKEVTGKDTEVLDLEYVGHISELTIVNGKVIKKT